MNAQSAPRTLRLPLKRSQKRIIAGVAEGLAEHLRVSPAIIRTFFIVSSLIFGFGVILYIWLWIFTPSATYTPDRADAKESLIDSARGTNLPSSLIVNRFRLDVLLSLVGLVSLFLFTPFLDFSDRRGWAFIGWAIPTVSITLAIFWKIFTKKNLKIGTPSEPARPLLDRFANIFVIWIVPLLTGFYSFFYISTDMYTKTNLVYTFWFSLFSFYFFLLPLAATIYETVQQKIMERETALRTRERSQMAAHLHDSVLQTLALIQNRAEPHSEISRIARAQERELREWLFSTESDLPKDLQAGLEETVKQLESEYAAEIDLVFVGSVQISQEQLPEILSATKEAMLNAARHAGGNISVYIEGTTRVTEIFIRDRGPGFVPEDLPNNRFGIRESIIGRIERLGGTAKIDSNPSGTQIHLSIPKVRKMQ